MLILSTSSLKGYGLHKIFVLAKKAWYDGIDLSLEKGSFDVWDKDYLKSLSDEFDMPILSITAPDKWMNKAKVNDIIEIAKRVNAQVITFSPPHFTDRNPEWFTRYIWKASKDNHIIIAAQNVEPKFLLFVIPEYKSNNLIDIKKATGYTSLNLSNIDKSSGMDILKAGQVLWNTLRNVYLNDKRGPKNDLLPWMAGGWISHLPLESFLMKLRTMWYAWYITLKVKPSELGAGNDQDVIKNLKYVKEYYTKHYLTFKA